MKEYGVASSELTDNKTIVFRKIFVENVICNFKNEGFDCSLVSHMNIIIVCNEMDMTYEFFMKQNMHVKDWKLNHLINKDKNLINKLPANWVHPLNRKNENYRA